MSKIPNPAVREGVLFGIGIGMLLLLLSLIYSIDPNIASLINYAILIGGYTFAGYRAARPTQRIKTGLVAGITAGSIAYLINLIVSMLVIIINVENIHKGILSDKTIPAAEKAQYTNQFIITLYLIQLLFGLLIFGTAVGALFGAIGAFLTRQRRKVVTTSNELVTVVDADDPAKSEPTTVVDADNPAKSEPATVVDADNPTTKSEPATVADADNPAKSEPATVANADNPAKPE
jgi:hypothetical protein